MARKKTPLTTLIIRKENKMEIVLNNKEIQTLIIEGLKARGFSVNKVLTMSVSQRRTPNTEAVITLEIDSGLAPEDDIPTQVVNTVEVEAVPEVVQPKRVDTAAMFESKIEEAEEEVAVEDVKEECIDTLETPFDEPLSRKSLF